MIEVVVVPSRRKRSSWSLFVATPVGATFALLFSLLPASATVIGGGVLAQVPKPAGIIGVMLVVCGVAVHQESTERQIDRETQAIPLASTDPPMG